MNYLFIVIRIECVTAHWHNCGNEIENVIGLELIKPKDTKTRSLGSRTSCKHLLKNLQKFLKESGLKMADISNI